MIKKVVETWHRVVARERPEALDSLLADEFETTIIGKYVNGVDIIRCDDKVHEQMRPMLASMRPQLHLDGR